ncbi:MAG: hypothetical protein Q8K85_21115, partial [Hyphomicrobium sp.]|nr:hypothetical protein [Hyphomicrobium sp.]
MRDVDVQRLLICKVPQTHRHAIRPRIVDFDNYIAGSVASVRYHMRAPAFIRSGAVAVAVAGAQV